MLHVPLRMGGEGPRCPAFAPASFRTSDTTRKPQCSRRTKTLWICRKGRSKQSTDVKRYGRRRSAKRTMFYEAMAQYREHFQPLLDAELKAEQAAVLAQRKESNSFKSHHNGNTYSLPNLVARRKNRLFSLNVFHLTQAKSEIDLHVVDGFSKGDLIDISPMAAAGDALVEGTVLAKYPTHLLITVPMGSEGSRLMDTFADSGEHLRAECGTNTVSYERATAALADLTRKGPNATDTSRLLVMSLVEMGQFKELYDDSTADYYDRNQSDEPQDMSRREASALSDKWKDLSRETVSKISSAELSQVTQNLPSFLNSSQRRAIRDALRCRLTLIQGPPGTGKTVTAAHLIHCAVQLSLGPVLACAASNVAADNLLRKVLQVSHNSIRAVRVGRVPAIDEDLWEISLESLLEKEPSLRKAREACADGSVKYSELLEMERKVAKKILDRANVVVATCIGSGRDVLKDRNFAFIVVDEATQATEPDVLIPLSNLSERILKSQLVLVGDHHQLPPTTLSRERNEAVGMGLETSLFLRMWKCGVQSQLLDTQYRMHPQISKFPCVHFYFRRLRDGISGEDRPLPKLRRGRGDSLALDSRVLFVNVDDGHEEADQVSYDGTSRGRSFFNKSEAEAVLVLLEKLLRPGADRLESADVQFSEEDIGVISPYNGQVRLLRNELRKVGSWRGVEVSTVDGFQGREKAVIIVSAVRSNEHGQVGFLRDWRRLNVALTRAKVLLVVVGDEDTLTHDVHWRSWIRWVKRNGMVLRDLQGR